MCGRDVVRLCDAHEALAGHVDLLTVREVGRVVEQREEPSSRRPGELVPERVVGRLRGGDSEAAAVPVELLDLRTCEHTMRETASMRYVPCHPLHAPCTAAYNPAASVDSCQLSESPMAVGSGALLISHLKYEHVFASSKH